MPLDKNELLTAVEEDLLPKVQAYIADSSDDNLVAVIFSVVGILITALKGL